LLDVLIVSDSEQQGYQCFLTSDSEFRIC